MAVAVIGWMHQVGFVDSMKSICALVLLALVGAALAQAGASLLDPLHLHRSRHSTTKTHTHTHTHKERQRVASSSW